MPLRIPLLAATLALTAIHSATAAAGEPELTALWSVPVAGGQPIEVATYQQPFTSIVAPSFSPDSKSITFVRVDGKVVVVTTDGSKQERTVATGASIDETEAVWSPDDETIAYIDGGGAVRGVPPAGGSRRTLVAARLKARGLRWSPDGRLLLFLADASQRCRNRSGKVLTRRTQAVFTVPASGGKPTQASTPDACRPVRTTSDWDAEWFPDSKRFAFERQTDNVPAADKSLNSGVYVGTIGRPEKPRLLTPYGRTRYSTSWLSVAPDGKQVAVARGTLTYTSEGDIVHGIDDLWLADVANASATRVLRKEGFGARFVRDRRVGLCDVRGAFLFDLTTRRTTRLFDFPDLGCATDAVSPDRTRLLVHADEGDTPTVP